jgi:hypothetical protein
MLKNKDQVLTEELLVSIVGKLIHVPQNVHKRTNYITGEEMEFNIWFAGQVVGYSKNVLNYDFMTDQITEKSDISFSLLLSDGRGYVITDDCEIEEISQEDFLALVEKTEKERAMEMVEDLGLPIEADFETLENELDLSTQNEGGEDNE